MVGELQDQVAHQGSLWTAILQFDLQGTDFFRRDAPIRGCVDRIQVGLM